MYQIVGSVISKKIMMRNFGLAESKDSVGSNFNHVS